MKESRMLIIASMCFFIVISFTLYICNKVFPGIIDYASVATNFYCAIIVALITSICQFYSARNRVVNRIYNSYFSIYKAHYYSKNKPILGHYNSMNVYKKVIEENYRINEALDEYHGMFRKHDKLYKKINFNVELGEHYTAKKVKKTISKWLNKEYYDDVVGNLIIEVEKILNNINRKRFEKDKEKMIKMYNYAWGVRTK